MNILQIYPKGDFYTGAAIQLRDLARGLVARGHRVTVVTKPSDRWAAEASVAGFTHHDFFRGPADPVGAMRLAGILHREQIDVAHAHKGGGRTLTLLARGLGRRPPLVVNRGVSFPMAAVSRWLDGGRLIARIVAVCQAIKDDLVRQGLPAAKIDVVYSGTDTAWFDPARTGGAGIRQELGLPPGVPLVTQIGVREPKGNDDLLRAFAGVHAARPDARLLLVGARPEKRAPLEALVRAAGLGNAVSIWGYRDDVPEILAATNVSVDASYEGLGITGTLRESLAMETPVVATRAMGNPELVLHDGNGLLVPPRDHEALAQAILRLLSDPDWARRLGRAGRLRVVQGFSTRAKVERLEGIYARLASPVRPPR